MKKQASEEEKNAESFLIAGGISGKAKNSLLKNIREKISDWTASRENHILRIHYIQLDGEIRIRIEDRGEK